MKSPILARVAALIVVAISGSACDSVLGLSHYTFRSSESVSGLADASTDAGTGTPGTEADAETVDTTDASPDATTCDVDLTSQCYPCGPKTSAQFLNACTKATCVPFDDSTRLTHLLPDGALPPLPIIEAGTPSDSGSESSDGDTE